MTQCYEFDYETNQPKVLPNVWVPCPVGNNCCIGIDKCMSNNLCYYGANPKSKTKRTWVGSGYYNARCTDPTYTDPACDKICINFPPDLVYNYTLQRWACCGNNTAGEVTCNTPLQEYFEAPAPESLHTLTAGAQYVSTETLTPDPQNAVFESSTAISGFHSSSATSIITSSTASSTSASSSTSVTSTSTTGLSTGAKAGIGVGIGVVVIACIIAIFFYVRYRGVRRKFKNTNESTVLKSELPDSQNRRVAYEKDLRQPPEIPNFLNQQQSYEMSFRNPPVELSSTDESADFSWQPTNFEVGSMIRRNQQQESAYSRGTQRSNGQTLI